MDNNEKVFLEKLMNLDDNISKAQQYIKEQYNVESEYSEQDDILYIWTPNVNENLNLATAREYIEKTVGEEFINIIYGEKQGN